MVTRTLGALLIAALSVAACHGETRATPASLKVIARPAAARVYVDGRFVASAQILARRPHDLPSGTHRITVSAPGYFPHDLEAELPSGVSTLEIALRPVPP